MFKFNDYNKNNIFKSDYSLYNLSFEQAKAFESDPFLFAVYYTIHKHKNDTRIIKTFISGKYKKKVFLVGENEVVISSRRIKEYLYDNFSVELSKEKVEKYISCLIEMNLLEKKETYQKIGTKYKVIFDEKSDISIISFVTPEKWEGLMFILDEITNNNDENHQKIKNTNPLFNYILRVFKPLKTKETKTMSHFDFLVELYNHKMVEWYSKPRILRAWSWKKPSFREEVIIPLYDGNFVME